MDVCRNCVWVLAMGVVALVLSCNEDEEARNAPLPAVSERDLPAKWDPDVPYTIGITPADLSAQITHLLFPAAVGTRWVYEGQTEDGLERVEIEVLAETRDVMGVAARVILDRVYLDDELIEETWDWYGQDAEGNVWYLGGDTKEYEDGEVKCSCGAWEWGKDGAGLGKTALPGVIMLAHPQIGDAYRQEYYPGEAEDLGSVVELNLMVTVRAGRFLGCVKTQDLSVTDRAANEYKMYCPGIGVVLSEDLVEGTTVELVSMTGLVTSSSP